MGKVYVCSDIHGDWIKYENAIKALKEDDTLYILGDATDRGDCGIKILQDIMRRRESKQGPKVEYVLGNHDMDLLRYMNELDHDNIYEVKDELLDKTYTDFAFDKRNMKGDISLLVANQCEETIKDVMKMTRKERIKLYDFIFNSYIQVVVGAPYKKTKCPNKFILAHSVAPFRYPKSFTLMDSYARLNNGRNRFSGNGQNK